MRILLSVTVLLCAAVPALAQPACTEPPMPRSVDGANVNADQLRAAVAAAKDFIAQSDVYQNCLVGELDAAKTQAGTEGHALDPGLERCQPDACQAGRQPEDQGKGRRRDQRRHRRLQENA